MFTSNNRAKIYSKKFLFCIIIIITTSSSTYSNEKKQQTVNFRFFVMGHVHAWFNSHIKPVINVNKSKLDYIFYTGDVVVNSNKENWLNISNYTDETGIETYIAPGNHDLTYADKSNNISVYTYPLYEEHFGATYKSFRRGRNLFLLTDTITSKYLQKQKDLFNNELLNIKNIKNIFIFSHYPQFIYPDSKFSCFKDHVHFDKNSSKIKDNIWLYIKSKITSKNINIYYFSGDIGTKNHAGRIQAPAIYDKTDNITILASGLGNPKHSYFDVAVNNANVEIKMVAYEKNIDVKLSDFEISKYEFCQ